MEKNYLTGTGLSTDELTHYGVKGMKWGVRRTPEQLGHLPSSAKKYLEYQDKQQLKAKSYIDEVFKDDETVKLYKEWCDKLGKISRAQHKAFINNEHEKYDALEKEHREVYLNHPYAKKKYSWYRDFIYGEASSKLKNMIDIAERENYSFRWLTDQKSVQDEIELLYLAFHLAYGNKEIQLDRNLGINHLSHSDKGDIMNNQLTHHGILGMKWGVRRTPEQLGHEPAKKKRKKPGNVFTRGKIKRQRLKNLEKARVARKEKAEYEAEKKKAIESGTAADVLKYKGKLTNMELQTAVNRLNMEAQLSQINQRTIKTGMDKTESFFNKVERTRGMAEKGISAYNTFAKVYNSLNENGIPTLDGSYKNQQEAKEKSERDKKVKKLIESGSMKEISKSWNTLSVEQRGQVNKRIREDKAFKRALDELSETPTTDAAEPETSKSKRKAKRSEPNRYYVTAGKEVLDELLKEFR